MNAGEEGSKTGARTVPSCPTCGRNLRRGMNFCPGCGTPVGSTGPAVTTGAGGTLHFHAPAQGPYSMPVLPMPGMYPRPVAPGRAGAVASGVLLIVSSVFVFITGVLYIFQGWDWLDFWVITGTICFFTFSLSIVGAIAIFRRMWRFVPVVAFVLLIVCSVLTFLDLWGLSLIILVLAIIGLVLLVTSWRQFLEPGVPMYQAHPGIQPLVPMGMGYPPQVGMMGPRRDVLAPTMGAPPPPMGAPPPAYHPQGDWENGEDGDEEIVVDVEAAEP